MSIFRFFSKLKKSKAPSKPVSLSTLLTSERLNRNLYLRPGTKEQRQHMLVGYLKAAKAEYPNGGHVFVGSTHAAEVMHYLDGHQITFTMHSLVELNTHGDILPIVDKAEGIVRVFVEDDELPNAERAERFLKVQEHFRPQCKPYLPLEPKNPEDMKVFSQQFRASKAEVRRLKRFVLFYDMSHSIEKWFPMALCQIKGLVNYCIISTDYAYEQTRKEPHSVESMDAKRILMINTLQIYGSGPSHWQEILEFNRELYNAERLNEIIDRGTFGKYFESIDCHGLCITNDIAVEVTLNE